MKAIKLTTFAFLFLPIVAKAQIESKTKTAQDSVKVDTTPQVLELTFEIFRDSTWGRGGLNTRMVKTNARAGTIERVYKPLNVNTVKFDDLVCEFYNADATVIVREIVKMPLLSHQEKASFSLNIQKELNAVKVEIRRVRSDLKTEKLGLFRLQ
jgi:hypothetical protein